MACRPTRLPWTEVVDELTARGIQAQRVAGPDQFATAVQAATSAGAAQESGDVVVALLRTHSAHGPMRCRPWSSPALPTARRLLVTPDGVPAQTADALHDLVGLEDTVQLLGGPGAVPDEVAAELADSGWLVNRIAGRSSLRDPTETATTVFRRPDADQRPLVIASGPNFPDGLSAAALAARTGGVLLMVPPSDLAQAPSTGRGCARTGCASTACSSSAARLRSATR